MKVHLRKRGLRRKGANTGVSEHLISDHAEHMIPEMVEHLKPERKHYKIKTKRLYD